MDRDLQGTRLRVRPTAIMLDTDQGSANSRRSSPGSGGSTPLRDALDWSPPAHALPVQRNHAALALPIVSPGVPLAPIPPRLIRAPTGPLIPQNWPPVSPRLTILIWNRVETVRKQTKCSGQKGVLRKGRIAVSRYAVRLCQIGATGFEPATSCSRTIRSFRNLSFYGEAGYRPRLACVRLGRPTSLYQCRRPTLTDSIRSAHG